MEKADFGVLGPLLVRSGGHEIVVRQGRQRTVLAVLLLNADRVVSVERLIDTLWGESPPPSADVAVRNYVMRLRRDLGPVKKRVVTQSPGYLMRVGPGEFDVTRFEALLESARSAGKSGSWALAAERAAAALALWRGDPLCDVASDALDRAETQRLTELRLQAVELRIDADLYLGRHAQVVAELERLIAAEPLRESLRAQLMLALYRSGRQGDSLAAYQRARDDIVGLLAVEPDEALRDLHCKILAGDRSLVLDAPTTGIQSPARQAPAVVAGRTVPRQLPRAADHFVGRHRELARLFGVLDRSGGPVPGAAPTVVITGTAGVGKTALALRWAHQVIDRFPDGQLYVNLRGYDPDQPLTADDVLSGFLRALGLPGERIPSDPDQRAAEFRTQLAGRRFLIVLDNARNVDQVRPLLPGSSSCLAVVTSRDALPGLVARDGAVRVDVDLLSAEDASRLMRDLIGERAVAAPESVARLVEGCCQLPLALRVAAELANVRAAEPLAFLASELDRRQGRLDLLEADGDARSAVREVFSWSYRNLDAETARVFRLAGLFPGPDFDVRTAAALAGVGLADAGPSLTRLAGARLIQPVGRGRYGLHDLLREYARELAEAQGSETERQDALTRLFDYYVHATVYALDALSLLEQSYYRPLRSGPATPVPVFAEPAEASAWLEAEWASLLAVGCHAADDGWPRHAIALSVILYTCLDRAVNPAELRALYAAAHRAAEESGDQRGDAYTLNSLASVDWRLGHFRQAALECRQSLEMFREIGDRVGEARAVNNLGTMSTRLGWYPIAMDCFQQSLALCREAGNRNLEASRLVNLSYVSLRLGRYKETLDYSRQALALGREVGSPQLEAYGLSYLATACLRADRHSEAIGHFQRALELFREVGNHLGEAEVLIARAEVDWDEGRSGQAVHHVRRGLALGRESGDWVHEGWALNTSGDVLRAVGQPAVARAYYSEALKVVGRTGDPYDRARAHHGLGCLYQGLAEHSRARSHWQQARSLYAEMAVPELAQVSAYLADGTKSLTR